MLFCYIEMNKNEELWGKSMAEEKKYCPKSVTQYTNKVKFKGYLFSIETQEWRDEDRVEGLLGKMVDANVYLIQAKNPSHYEFQAIVNKIPLRNEKKFVSDKFANYSILIQRLFKKDLEESLRKDPKAYFKSIESAVEDHEQKRKQK